MLESNSICEETNGNDDTVNKTPMISGTRSSWVAVSSMCTAIIGVGIISLPIAFKKCGLIGGILLLSASAFVTNISLNYLVDSLNCEYIRCRRFEGGSSADEHNQLAYQYFSYESLTHRLCGSKAGALVELSIFVFTFGTKIAYVVAVGDILEESVINVFELPIGRKVITTMFWFAFMLPLSLQKTMEHLKYSSSFGLIAGCFFACVCVYESANRLMEDGFDDSWGSAGVRLWPESFGDALEGVSIMIFAFNVFVTIPRIYSESGPSSQGCQNFMKNATRKATICCYVVYLSMASFAYLNYGDHTNEDVLNNFCIQDNHSVLTVSAFTLLAMKVCAAFPLFSFSCRDTIIYIISRQNKTIDNNDRTVPLLRNDMIQESDDELTNVIFLLCEDADEESEDPNIDTQPVWSREWQMLLSFTISSTALIIGLFIPDVSFVLSLVGGTSGALLAFIMPPMFALKLGFADDRYSRMIALTLIYIGISIAILSIFFTVRGRIVNEEDDDDPCAK